MAKPNNLQIVQMFLFQTSLYFSDRSNDLTNTTTTTLLSPEFLFQLAEGFLVIHASVSAKRQTYRQEGKSVKILITKLTCFLPLNLLPNPVPYWLFAWLRSFQMISPFVRVEGLFSLHACLNLVVLVYDGYIYKGRDQSHFTTCVSKSLYKLESLSTELAV